MKFIIDGKQYPATSLDRVSGLDELALQRQTGMGLVELAKRLEECDEKNAEGIQAVNPFDSERHMVALLALLWLSRRRGGEPTLTVDEACDFPLLTLGFEGDDDPAVETEPIETDPQLPA